MVDLLGATVGEAQGEDSLDQPVHQTKEPGPCHHEPADTAAHDHWVPQRVADGHIAVIGHKGQQEAFIPQQGEEEEDLDPTACEGDGATAQEEVCGHAWHNGADKHEVHEWQPAEEEVHGAVQAGVSVDEEEHEPIARERHQEHEHNGAEEEEVQRWASEEAQEDELGDESLVSHPGHCSCRGMGRRDVWDLEDRGSCVYWGRDNFTQCAASLNVTWFRIKGITSSRKGISNKDASCQIGDVVLTSETHCT